jgi:hypothetical protein
MGDTSKEYISKSNSKNSTSLLGSKAQEGVFSGVERRQESREASCDCLRLSERRKKNSRGEKKITVQTKICNGRCCLSFPKKIESEGVAVKKNIY